MSPAGEKVSSGKKASDKEGEVCTSDVLSRSESAVPDDLSKTAADATLFLGGIPGCETVKGPAKMKVWYRQCLSSRATADRYDSIAL